jgi:hypothetical protein
MSLLAALPKASGRNALPSPLSQTKLRSCQAVPIRSRLSACSHFASRRGSAGGEAVAAADLVVAEAEAEPVLAFTGGNSDGAVPAGVLMLGLGFGSLAVQRCRRNSTFF